MKLDYEAIALRHTPPKVRVIIAREDTDIKEDYYALIHRNGRRTMRAPKPDTREGLHLYLHECGHFHLDAWNGSPDHVIEFEAEMWARGIMKAEGVPLPRRTANEMRDYIRGHCEKDHAAFKSVRKDIARWSKYR